MNKINEMTASEQYAAFLQEVLECDANAAKCLHSGEVADYNYHMRRAQLFATLAQAAATMAGSNQALEMTEALNSMATFMAEWDMR